MSEELTSLHPLGTVVTLIGSDKPLMVISRGVNVQEQEGSDRYYDYGLCLYPEGLVGDMVVYSNHDRVNEVLFVGYETPASKAYSRAIAALGERNPGHDGSTVQEDVW